MGHALAACRASRLDGVYVVLGPNDDAARKVIASSKHTHVLENPGPARGLMSSLKVALSALPDACEAAMVFHADMPLVTADLIDRLIGAFRPDHIVMPVCDDRWRHPRIIPRRLFGEFLALGDDEKGLTVIKRHLPDAILVQETDSDRFLDVDSIEDAGLAEDLLGRTRNQ
jgi:molybdenum cofactor cytidylyltransferase